MLKPRVLLPSLFALVAGCDDATFSRTPAFIAASAVEIDFGEREVGSMEERTVFLINQGQQPLELSSPVGDSLSGVFAAVLVDTVVQSEEETILTIRFNPFDEQPYETFYSLENNSTNEPRLYITVRGVGIARDPCADMDCYVPPLPSCVTATTSRRYQPLGVCTDGRCEHTYVDEPCERGCNDGPGTCRGDPCSGVTCNTPPSGCFFAGGTCNGGACEYMVNNAGTCDDNKACTTGDRCEEGNCVGDQRVCDTPPDALCLDATTRRFWSTQGTCDQASGACQYMQQDQQCQFGCQDGLCMGDPCAGIVCNTPPNTECYQSTGTCTDGLCDYATVTGNCNDGDACTTGDVCNNGTCSGNAMVCNTPPASVCQDGTTLTVYGSNGTCSNGTCQYTPSALVCNDNDACTTNDFCSAGACRSGAMTSCSDGNACTIDSCDPVSGCNNAPTSGNACISASNRCPTGTCSAGTCLPTAGIACVATYEVCLGLIDQDVAGVCSASGQCVVSQAPPQFICPGCAGLCLQCPPLNIQVCVPF